MLFESGQHFQNPGVISYAVIPRGRPNSTLVFNVSSVVHGRPVIPKRLLVFSACVFSFRLPAGCRVSVLSIEDVNGIRAKCAVGDAGDVELPGGSRAASPVANQEAPV